MTLCGVHDNMHVHTTVAHTCDYPLYLHRHICAMWCMDCVVFDMCGVCAVWCKYCVVHGMCASLYFPKYTITYIYIVLHISCCVHIFVHFEEYTKAKANSLYLPNI